MANILLWCGRVGEDAYTMRRHCMRHRNHSAVTAHTHKTPSQRHSGRKLNKLLVSSCASSSVSNWRQTSDCISTDSLGTQNIVCQVLQNAVLNLKVPTLRLLVLLVTAIRGWRCVWELVEWQWQEKPEVLTQKPVPVPLYHKLYTDCPGVEPGHSRERSATNRLSHGTELYLKIQNVPRSKPTPSRL